ncbi:MAG: hypothetical protein A2W26_09000 [Acidobacteria bacterium RBG_16_64_8]|nr:MAG: hypothetical protein A2W26_09000 [Acidobacteria bacterium RBG_16_64_8]
MNRAFRAGHLISAAFLAVLSTGIAAASTADVNGMPLCTAANDQILPVTVSDGAGGIIVVWLDGRPPTPGVIYGQRVDAAGVPQWAADGVQLSTTADTGTPVIDPDGAGGVFIAFGGRFSPPRAQRVNASGVPQWGADGIPVTNDVSSTRELAIAPDIGGTGGAFVAWRHDNGAGGNPDVHAQKLNSSGALQWGQGIAITSSNMNSEGNPAVVSDGVGGAHFVWIGGAGVRWQRYDGSGNALSNPLVLAATGNNIPPSIVSDGGGGAIVAWSGGGAFIQRITQAGDRIWGVMNAGLTLSTSGRAPTLIGDAPAGAIVTWEDNRGGSNFNIFAQRVNSSGTAQWQPDGAEVCVETADQRAPKIVSDGNGGAIISWFDARMSGFSGTDIYAQRLNGSGASQWLPTPTGVGVAICTAPNNQVDPTMASDGSGGAWIAWQDRRSGTNEDIYAARVNPDGALVSVPLEQVPGWKTWPNPFSDRVVMSFVLPAAARVRTKVYNVDGRVVADLGSASLSEGPHRITWDGRTSEGRQLGGGVYFIHVEGSGFSLSRSVVRLK